ncbi:amidohydrolase [Ilyonectria destructans]|nr:amidohydrolase [Ilyonectria destructans]
MSTAIQAARVLPSSQADIVQDDVVVVCGDRITKVGTWDSLKDFHGTSTVEDLGDVTLMPGLSDCHLHLQMDPAKISTSTKSDLSDAEILSLMVKHSARLLDAGHVYWGFMTAGSHPSKVRFTLEEMRAIKQEAKKHGMPVTTHATGAEGIDMAADADFDCKAIFDPVLAQKLVDKEIPVCPTMNTACIERCYFCPWDTRDVIVDNLIKMREIGVRIVVGTDAGIGLCLHERYADGLTVMADAGWTPREIAKAATEEAAKVCGLEAETRRLEPGMAADLAAFQGNPVEDVKNYARPKWVMALGRVHKMQPIEPLGDIKAQADIAMTRLREGAGLVST